MIAKKSRPYIVVILSFFLLAFEPPESERDSESTSASSTRGCLQAQGELSLIGPNPLKTHLSKPIFLFKVNPASSQEKLLVVIKDENFQVVFEKKIVINKAGYLSLPVDANLTSQKYRLVAGLLCENKIRHAKVLEVDLILVNAITANDLLIQQYLERNSPESHRFVPRSSPN